MKLKEIIKNKSEIDTHSIIDKLTSEQLERLKRLIDDVCTSSNRDFKISKLTIKETE